VGDFPVSQEIRRIDGTVAAELDVLAGVLDLRTRKLLPDPGAVLRSLASAAEVLGN
jgi:acyl-CoA thioester hydrolase